LKSFRDFSTFIGCIASPDSKSTRVFTGILQREQREQQPRRAQDMELCFNVSEAFVVNEGLHFFTFSRQTEQSAIILFTVLSHGRKPPGDGFVLSACCSAMP
jgi:hypothetical protein